MNNRPMPKRVLEQEISELRKQRILIYREEQRLQEMLDRYEEIPPEPDNGTVLHSYVPALGGRCVFVRNGKTWYGFFTETPNVAPGQYTWEGLCGFLHTTHHRGLSKTAPGTSAEVLKGNMI